MDFNFVKFSKKLHKFKKRGLSVWDYFALALVKLNILKTFVRFMCLVSTILNICTRLSFEDRVDLKTQTTLIQSSAVYQNCEL